MATSTMFTGEDSENRKNTNEEETLPSSNNDDHKNVCITNFLRMEATLNGLFEDMVKRKSQLHTDVNTFQTTLNDLMNSNDNTDVVEDALRNHLKLKISQLKKSEAENSTLKSEISKFKAEFGELESELKQSEAENSKLKSEISKFKAEFGELESKLKQSEAENSTLESEISKFKAGFGELETKHKQSEAENSILESEISKFKAGFGELETKHKQSEAENSTLESEISKFKAGFGELETKHKQSEAENSILESEISKFKDEFGELESELKQSEAENSELKSENIKFKAGFEELESELKQSEAEKSKLKSENIKFKAGFEEFVSELKQSEVEKSKLESEISKFKAGFGELETKHKQSEAENSTLKSEISKFKDESGKLETIVDQYKKETDILKDNIEKSESCISQLKQEKDELLLNLTKSDERTNSNSWEQVPTGNDVKSGRTQLSSKAANEGKRNEDENCTILHQDILDLMERWYQRSYSDIFTSVIQNNTIENSTVEDILFHTLWKIYKFSRDATFLQLTNLRRVLYYPYQIESMVPDPTVPKDINYDLKRLMAKAEIKEGHGQFKDDWMQQVSTKYPKFPTNSPKFHSYMNECLRLCHQLILKSECLHLKSALRNTNLDSNVFNLSTGNEKDPVKRVILPALICVRNNTVFTLRKGSVSSLK